MWVIGIKMVLSFMTKEIVTKALIELGKRLGFRVGTEIQASNSAWVDVVWFDERFDFGPAKGELWSRVKTWQQPVLPAVGFEIEASAGAKPLKGSVANLEDLGALMSVIVLSDENVERLRKRSNIWSNKSINKIWRELRRRAIQWVYETRPTIRIVVMTEPEIKEWAKSKGLSV